MNETIISQKIENSLFITLNRPDSFNSFTHEMRMELQKVLSSAESDDTIRCIVIKGEGRAFCAGQDLKEATSDEWLGFPEVLENGYNPIIKKINDMSKPVVGAINGVAAGAGANIALACDIVIAKESASFIQAFVNIGLVPDSGGSFLLPKLIGKARAKAACMLGDKIKANKAEEIGLIYKSVPDEEFDEAILKMAEKLSSMPTKALGMIKHMINSASDNDLDKQLLLEKKYQVAASESEDYAEGVKAFLEKRKPIFKGK